MVQKYKVDDIYFSDDQFLGNKKFTLQILDGLIERNYGITIDAPNGLSPWILNEELIKKMKILIFLDFLIFGVVQNG